MEKPQSVVSEKDTLETIMEKENISKISVDQPQTSTEPADPSSSGFESITETESENQLWLFVILLTLSVDQMSRSPELQSRGVVHPHKEAGEPDNKGTHCH